MYIMFLNHSEYQQLHLQPLRNSIIKRIDAPAGMYDTVPPAAR